MMAHLCFRFSNKRDWRILKKDRDILWIKIVKFVDNSFEIDVRTDINNETVWLSQEEMALLFDVDRTRIVRHNNIYKDKELDVTSICAENAQVQIEGKRKVNRAIIIYNLGPIICVWYSVKSHSDII